MDQTVWLINRDQIPLEICVTELRKWIIFPHNKPKPLPASIALKYMGTYKNLQICDEPTKYYTGKTPAKQLIIRDAGIGDLLLLEPVIREIKKRGNVSIDVLTRYPEVYYHNPNINQVIRQDCKDNTNAVKLDDYDVWEDLRSYSENCPNRNKKHRTDIYNEKWGFDIKDKEPRLYFEGEKSILRKKPKFKYIGLQLDASHNYRKFFKNEELVQYLISQGKFKVVLLGDRKIVRTIHSKHIVDLQGKTNIRQAINVVSDLDYMIAVDSGLMHVALALHIPTICIFNIITPDFRVKYYTGPFEVIIKKDLDCLGCGDWHMSDCKYEQVKGLEEFIPPCMDLDVREIYNKMIGMTEKELPRVFEDEAPKVNINLLPEKKLTMPIIVQNEEKNLPRFIENVINNPYIGRVIAIDGGSTDKTVKLLKMAGAEVYIHPYIKDYHEQQAMQRNISCSYVKNGDNIIIMDIDECFSQELAAYLPFLVEVDYAYGVISRRTFNYYSEIKDPGKQIKDYPDWQPRFYKWDWKFKFVGGAHHMTLNTPEPVKIQKDIIHFEKEGKDRVLLENQWSSMMTGVKQYA